MIRGMYEHWARSPPESDIANLIQAFFLIQVGNHPHITFLFDLSHIFSSIIL